MKQNQKCFALFVNVTSGYISFKITKGRYLGKVEQINPRLQGKYNCVFEDDDDSVDYMSESDLFLTEDDAIRALIKMLNERVNKGKK